MTATAELTRDALKDLPGHGGYDIDRDENGEWYGVNITTGETVGVDWRPYIVGHETALTDIQKEAIRRKKEQAEKQERSRSVNRSLGDFYFADKGTDFKNLKPATVTRLFYLCSFLDYDSDVLMKNDTAPLLKSDLTEYLKIKRGQVYNFLEEVSPQYLRVNDDGTISANVDIFSKGKLTKEQKRESRSRIKVYQKSIRRLYEAADKTQHKHLGRIFQIIPFINMEFNIVCHNPQEKELDYIEPMSIREFCEEIDFDYSHVNRLKDTFRNVKFEVTYRRQKTKQPFVSTGKDDNVIIINPRVMYSGSDYNRVKVLGKFFE